MDTRTPTLILLGSLLAALALSLLGLAADNAAYYNAHRDSTIDLHYMRWNATASSQYSYWIKLDYAPSRFSLARTYASLANGVICALLGLAISIGAWFARKQKANTTYLPVATALGSISFVISLAMTGYAWTSAMKFPVLFRNSIPLPPMVSNPAKEAPTKYMAPFAYTPEIWNCNLASFVVEPAAARAVSKQCQEARVGRYMMLPVLVVSALLLATVAGMWIKARKAGGEEVREAKDVDEVSIESAGVEMEAKN